LTKLTKQIVIDAKELIKEPQRWSKGGAVTREKSGDSSYCLGGALAYAATGDATTMYEPELRWLFWEFVRKSGLEVFFASYMEAPELYEPEFLVYLFNDSSVTEHTDVLGLLDKTLETYDE